MNGAMYTVVNERGEVGAFVRYLRTALARRAALEALGTGSWRILRISGAGRVTVVRGAR